MQRIGESPFRFGWSRVSVLYLLLSILTSNAGWHDRHDFHFFLQFFSLIKEGAEEALSRERKVHSMHRREM
jgi:hypothetical protein